MKQWTKKQKITLAAIIVVIVAAIGILVGVSLSKPGKSDKQISITKEENGNKQTDPVEDGKTSFTITVTSERDDYNKTTECESDEEFLGEFLRTYEACEWQESDYGIYITGFDGMAEDIANEYWWCVSVNGESAMTGADEIALEDGASYEFELKQGW